MPNKKKTFLITIEEHVSDMFEVEANSLEEALEIAKEKYLDCEFVLEPGEVSRKLISGFDPEDPSDSVDLYEF